MYVIHHSFDIAICSVRPSVRLSHAGIVTLQIKLYHAVLL